MAADGIAEALRSCRQYILRVVIPDQQNCDLFYKKLIHTVPLKNITSRFAMEKIESMTALPIPLIVME